MVQQVTDTSLVVVLNTYTNTIDKIDWPCLSLAMGLKSIQMPEEQNMMEEIIKRRKCKWVRHLCTGTFKGTVEVPSIRSELVESRQSNEQTYQLPAVSPLHHSLLYQCRIEYKTYYLFIYNIQSKNDTCPVYMCFRLC